MFDIKYNEDEFIVAINDLAPFYQVSTLVNLVKETNLEESDYDQIGMSLTGERKEYGLVSPASAQTSCSKSMWAAIKSEVYDLLCTNSKKYSKERTEGVTTMKNIITIIATAIASSFKRQKRGQVRFWLLLPTAQGQGMACIIALFAELPFLQGQNKVCLRT